MHAQGGAVENAQPSTFGCAVDMGLVTAARGLLALRLVQIPSPDQVIILTHFILVLSPLLPRKMHVSVILAGPALFPLGSNFCHLHRDAVAPPSSL